MISRKLYPQLITYLDHFPVIGIVGPRQVGKTTLVKVSALRMKKPSIYLDLESPSDRNKLTDVELFLERYQDQTVIIDEIQSMPDLFPVLRSLVDRKRLPGRFIILGSASPDLIRDSSESLAGRIVYLEMSPFDIIELSGIKDLNRVWLHGGFPDAVLQDRDEIRSPWMKNFVRTYIERDLPLLGLGAPMRLIERLWQMLAHLNGNLLNYSMLANSLDVSVNSVRSYINFLEQAYLIRILKPYSTNSKKRLVKTPKLYFRDSGILHYFLRIRNSEDLYGHPGLGNSWEAFAIQQIINNIPEELDVCFYRTQDGSELDLVLTRGVDPIATVEIKHTNAPKLSKGNTQAINNLGCMKNFIVTPSSEKYPIRDNVIVIGLLQFVEEVSSL